ncbi:hypothetical protein WSK_2295 [Novosphingobium sp. Rr 2-17]|uniref:DUF4350 domain-containing protein n=1 Tax=Novosphingobium sp. Rr 2-17 TaxID=555793 RepID=UPI0002699EBC|nr:DUF4350 domain-containing protein [Novosphingobium sp. Rr 2-17]EIZ79108.1 hypothetical protein WSK_2295 [Novosphingobium sp. Rr 2-17]
MSVGSAVRTPSTGAVDLGASPFSRWAVLAIVLLGSALFVALLWMIGTGTGFGNTNDGEAHVGGKGLNGYAAMADYLEARGYQVTRARNEGGLDKPGLLVLTPPAGAEGKEIEKIVNARRYIGPTLVISPKWQATAPLSQERDKVKAGWVRLGGTRPPEWKGFLDEVYVSIDAGSKNGARLRWEGMDLAAPLPDDRFMLSGSGKNVVPLVESSDGRTLAGFIADEGYYPQLEVFARAQVPVPDEDDNELHPLVVVFEPDLLDNYGMANLQNAQLAEALVRASGVKPGGAVVFDMTLNGFGRAQNLLTLAFTPPFLAATLCLILAAVIVGWRAFLRFGPPLAGGRAIAFGKRALVSNAAGMILRSRRLHLIGGPYADRARERLVAALALPRSLDVAQAEDAIDRALARRPDARQTGAEPFTQTFTAVSARLRAARGVPDLLKAARDLHALERKLTR